MVNMQSSIHARGHMWSPEDIFLIGFYFFLNNIGFRDWTQDTRLTQEVLNPLNTPIGPQKHYISTFKPARIKKHHRKGSWNIIRASWRGWAVECYLVEKTHLLDSWIHTLNRMWSLTYHSKAGRSRGGHIHNWDLYAGNVWLYIKDYYLQRHSHW